MTDQRAIEIVIELASENILDEKEAQAMGVKGLRSEQLEAVALVEALVQRWLP